MPTEIQKDTVIFVCQLLSILYQFLKMVIGSLTEMTKPDFKTMNRKELKKYILAHPTDDEAIRELVLNRKNPNATLYPPPSTMPYEEFEAIFQSKLSQSEKNSPPQSEPNS